MSVVLDASALLAVIFAEPGSEVVEPVLEEAVVSAVNYSEVLQKVASNGGAVGKVGTYLSGLGLVVAPFDEIGAALAADLYPTTQPLGLGLADRACLALGSSLDLTVYTADRAWSRVESVNVKLIR